MRTLGKRRPAGLPGAQAVQHQLPAPVHHARLDDLVIGGVGLQDRGQRQLRRWHRRLPLGAVCIGPGQFLLEGLVEQLMAALAQQHEQTSPAGSAARSAVPPWTARSADAIPVAHPTRLMPGPAPLRIPRRKPHRSDYLGDALASDIAAEPGQTAAAGRWRHRRGGHRRWGTPNRGDRARVRTVSQQAIARISSLRWTPAGATAQLVRCELPAPARQARAVTRPSSGTGP
jgi:hypothetical protein